MNEGVPESPVKRETWLKMLNRLKPFGYELVFHPQDVQAFFEGIPQEERIPCLRYLHDHNLVDAKLGRSLDGIWNFGGVSLTTRGMDYLREDGGLTAELGITTVRLEADTLKALLSVAVDKTDATSEKKGIFKHAIQTLPAEGLKALTGELVKHGLQDGPWLLGLLGKAFSH
ncbi:MAG: hypothetical protein ABF572_04640 [Gluconobacter sp.]|uniref:hypothetical protein n=1 Tax=Gluconobacter sp. TaxID=1876758 RepID=UPI0039EC78C7